MWGVATHASERDLLRFFVSAEVGEQRTRRRKIHAADEFESRWAPSGNRATRVDVGDRSVSELRLLVFGLGGSTGRCGRSTVTTLDAEPLERRCDALRFVFVGQELCGRFHVGRLAEVGERRLE